MRDRGQMKYRRKISTEANECKEEERRRNREKNERERRQAKYQPSASHTYLYFKEKAAEQTDQLQVGFILNFIAGHLSSLGREHELPS